MGPSPENSVQLWFVVKIPSAGEVLRDEEGKHHWGAPVCKHYPQCFSRDIQKKLRLVLCVAGAGSQEGGDGEGTAAGQKQGRWMDGSLFWRMPWRASRVDSVYERRLDNDHLYISHFLHELTDSCTVLRITWPGLGEQKPLSQLLRFLLLSLFQPHQPRSDFLQPQGPVWFGDEVSPQKIVCWNLVPNDGALKRLDHRDASFITRSIHWWVQTKWAITR